MRWALVYPRLKPLPPTLIREIDVKGGTAVQYRDYFDGRDKSSNEYLLKNDVREDTAKHYHADSGALMGESEYKNGVRDGLYRRYYFDEGGVLMQEAFLRRTNERVWKHDTTERCAGGENDV